MNGQLRVGLLGWLRLGLLVDGALQVGHHLVSKGPEVEHLSLLALQLQLTLEIAFLLCFGQFFSLLLAAFHAPCLLQYHQTVLPQFVLPVGGLSERIVLEEDLQSLDASQGLQHPVIGYQIACDIEITQRLEWHQVVESPLKTVVGKIQFLQMSQHWEVLQFPEIAVGHSQRPELRVRLKKYLRLGWNELEIECGDDD